MKTILCIQHAKVKRAFVKVGFFLLTLCVGMPIMGYSQISMLNFDGATTIPVGNLQPAVDYSQLWFGEMGMEHAISLVGVSLGTGIGQSADLKLKFNRFSFEGEGLFSLVQLIPKISDKKGTVAMKVPMGVFVRKVEGDGIYRGFIISPRFPFKVLSQKWFEWNLTPGCEIYKFKGAEEVTFNLGMILGLAFSSDVKKWAIRPEVSYYYNLKYKAGIWNIGIGASYNINLRGSG